MSSLQMLRTAGLSVALVLLACCAAQAAPAAFRTIHVFSSISDGNSPRAALVLDSSGVAYGTTLFGGSSNRGAVYQLTPVSGTEKWTERIIYNFAGGADGANPAGSLVIGAGGVLYGTTVAGGASGAGTVFALTPPIPWGEAWSESVLYNFAGAPDGAAPHAGLLMGANSVLYGTTANGGAGRCGCGTIFSLTPPATRGAGWTETVLHSFAGSDGANPFASLVAGPGGLLYGTASNGGVFNDGTLFSLRTGAGALIFKTLHSFTGGADGANPFAALTVSVKGILYGTARNAGGSGMGTLFSMTTAGKLEVLHTFTGASDGANPVAGVLVESTNLFGAASLGGAHGDGTLFVMQLSGTRPVFKVLHTFDGANQSANPLATPILAPSEALLGTAEPQQVLDPVAPDPSDGGSAYLYCTKNPPACKY